ncbi:MAG: hypothetical protein D4R64_00165 [Porphyromonadaceae bacterium]|nr:MAG: hypothetical protein D4R64_00165 [Porphyromonadaceae bacterium]
MKRFARLPVFAILVLLSGCYVANMLEFDGLKPAEVAISASIQSLTVVSRCDLDSVYKVSLESLGRIKDFDRDSIMAKQVVLGCSDALVESPRFDLFNPIVRRSLVGDFSDPSRKIPWDMIQIIAGDPPRDAVLSLEIGVIKDTIKYSLQDGWLRTYTYNVVVKTLWRLYRLSDFQSKEFNFADTVAFDIDSPSEFTSSPDQRLECIRNAMYEAGVQTAERLAPWWTNFQRYYFTMGSQKFINGAKLLRDGKWQEAAEIWRPYTESSNKLVAAKACFNMSLTCEIANNIPAALDWLKQSEKLGMHEFYIKDYQSKLEKRKAETDKLDEQMR